MQDAKAVIYARYSGDKQRETSIDDQVRNCSRYAEHEGLVIRQVYSDKAISGAVSARSGYQQMQSDAASQAFDVLLVDDLSRLSRDDYEMKGVLRRLAWQGLRVVGVTDGYDSTRKGHKIHAGFKGLMNEIFLDDLRERTHRGMTGQALKGYNCGGRTYGYRNVPIEDPGRKDAYGRPAVLAVRYEIDEEQGEVVRKIYDWYAQGHSYKWIACELNRCKIPASRRGTWVLTAVKVILENEMYEGRFRWNRRAWIKHPETGKRTYRERPQEEWIVSDNPRLRIVPENVIAAVRRRQERNKSKFADSFTQASAQRYLFSGLMTCDECGGNMVIVASGRYGCASHKTRGPSVCGNSVTVSRLIVEHRILSFLKSRLLTPRSLEEFKRAAVRVLESRAAEGQTEELVRLRKATERDRDNLIAAIKQGIVTPSTKEALMSAEAEVVALNARIDQAKQWHVPAILPRAVERYQEAVDQLETRLQGHVEAARDALRAILGERIRIQRAGEHLLAIIPNHVSAILTASTGYQFDSFGCGGAQRIKSYCDTSGTVSPTRDVMRCCGACVVSLEPSLVDSIPLNCRTRQPSRRK